MLEGYTSLGFLAGADPAMALGLLVTGVTYRHPGLLAKIVTTLDVLSGGRADARASARPGTSASTSASACRSRRSPSASSGSRRRCRSAADVERRRRPVRRAGTTSWPRRSARPRRSSRPRPPILIGGSGERKTLRLVAQYADACNLFAATLDEVAHKLDVLARHCDDVGRDPATIERRSCSCAPFADVDGFLADMAGYARARRHLVDHADRRRTPWAFVRRARRSSRPPAGRSSGRTDPSPYARGRGGACPDVGDHHRRHERARGDRASTCAGPGLHVRGRSPVHVGAVEPSHAGADARRSARASGCTRWRGTWQ